MQVELNLDESLVANNCGFMGKAPTFSNNSESWCLFRYIYRIRISPNDTFAVIWMLPTALGSGEP